MPTITRQQLDEIVDANVTNKTAPLSLTPQQEGFAIKKVADYVDDNKQDLSQKSQDISAESDSEVKYPSTKAVADYAEKIGNKKQEVTGESEEFYLSEKAVVDYVENELSPINQSIEDIETSITNIETAIQNIPMVVKVQKTTITQAQLLALTDSPVTVLSNNDSDIEKVPISILLKRPSPGTAYTSENLYLTGPFGGSVISTINQIVITSASQDYKVIAFPTNQYNNIGSFMPSEYKLMANVSNPTGGTGDLDVYVTYIEIPLVTS
jgi:hypothetical protein